MGRKSRRNNASRKRRNTVSMRKRRNNMTMRRNNMLRRMMYGGYESVPGSVNGNSMAPMVAQSLAQGNQFAALHRNQHGGGAVNLAPGTLPPGPAPMPMVRATPGPMNQPVGPASNLAFKGSVEVTPTLPPGPMPPGGPMPPPPPGGPMPPPPPSSGPRSMRGGRRRRQRGGGLDAGPFPGAVISPSVLPENLHASARVAPLDAAIKEIQGLKDQSGGGKKRRGSRKGRKARKTRRGRKSYRGGAYSLENAQSVSAPGLILPPRLEAQALSGMNAEWKLAENPKAFAPGYASY